MKEELGLENLKLSLEELKELISKKWKREHFVEVVVIVEQMHN
jgi:hypothetical protein